MTNFCANFEQPNETSKFASLMTYFIINKKLYMFIKEHEGCYTLLITCLKLQEIFSWKKNLTLKNVLILKMQAQFITKSTLKNFFMSWKVVSSVHCT
jgi:hypothetical protein